MQLFQFAQSTASRDTDNFQELLASFHLSKQRPLCLCVQDGVPMYVAKADGKFLIKRMPDTGAHHSPECDSYEPPPELSGIGQVMGNAIQEDPDSGLTALKLDFSLSKAAGKRIPQGDGAESDSVTSKGSRLTLRGTLHYLWESAGFNKWSPRMADKRPWYVIRKYLLEAATKATAKKSALDEILYIPEAFSSEHKHEIEQRRIAKFEPFRAKATGGARKLMMLIGEVKDFGDARFGKKIIVKHAPDYPFYMDTDLFKAMSKRFATELELWGAENDRKLVAIATFGISASGLAQIEEISLTLTTDSWIPFENLYELELIERLITEHRRFYKSLRYNLPTSAPLASVVLTDTPKATALYIQTSSEVQDIEAMNNLISESDLPSWLWGLSDAEVPELPGKMA